MTKDRKQKESTEGTRYLGAEVPAELADRVTRLCEERNFVSKELIRTVMEDFLELPEAVQIDIYHRRRNRDDALKQNVVAVLRELQLLPPDDPTDPQTGKR